MVHEGVMRRSEEEFSEVTKRGISPAVCMLILDSRVSDRLTVHSVPDVRSLGRRFVPILPSAVSEIRPGTKSERADAASEIG